MPNDKHLAWLITRFRIRESEIMMATDRAHYQAYMLRLWQDQDGTSPDWCASLESPHTGERHGFASLEALFDFLRQRADQQGDGSPTMNQAASGGSHKHDPGND